MNGYASISRRGRGIYLAMWGEHQDGTQEWDAFGTLAEAKRWCAKALDRKRLPWVDITKPGKTQVWFAEVGEQ